MKLQLGPTYLCSVCTRRHYVDSALRTVHIVGRHPTLIPSIMKDPTALDWLFIADWERH